MKKTRRYYPSHKLTGPHYQFGFFNLFKRKSGSSVKLRPGAMTPEALKKRITEIGTGKVVEIIRIGYDGTIDDIPMTVEITNIWQDGFSGRVVNVERELIEESSQMMVYAKRGGGTIEFKFTDGDIKEIVESTEAEELSKERNVSAILEIVEALDINDRVLVAYFDKNRRGTVNVEGVLLSKDIPGKSFRVVIDKINNIELENKMTREFNILSDLIIDVAMM